MMEPVRVTPDDTFIVERTADTTSSVLLILRMSEDRAGKRMRPRPVVFDISHVAGGLLPESRVLDIPTGWIQSGYVRNDSIDIERGMFYVEVLMQAFGIPHTQLAFGQVYRGHNLAFGAFEDPLASPGRLKSITTANPAAGAEFAAEAVPTNARWLVRGWHATCAVGAAGITPQLHFRDGSDTIIFQAPMGTLTAGASERVSMGIGAESIDDAASRVSRKLPVLFLPEGFDIISAGITGDDDWGVALIEVEEWIEI